MQVVKNFLYNLSYQILIIILPLITVPYVSNILGARGIGDYAFTYANTQYFVIFGMVGISLYANRQIAYVRDNKIKLKNTFYSIYLLQLITTISSLILFIIFTLVFNNNQYKTLYMAQGINIISAMFDISWLFMGLEQFKKTVVRNSIVKLISLASIFIFVKDANDVLIYTLIISLSALFGNLTFWLYIPKSVGFNNIEVSNIFKHLKSSLALFIPQISIQIYLLLDRTLLGVITNSIQVGYYENSQKIVKMMLLVASAIGTVMMPKIANTIARGENEKVKYYTQNTFFFVNLISIPLMFGLNGIIKELTVWFFGNNFYGIESLITISSPIIIAISWSSILGMQLLVPLNKTKEFTISVTVGAIINFILNLIFIRYLGAIGACLATVISEWTVTIVQFYYIKDFIKPVKLIKQIVIFIPSAIIMYIIVRVVGNFMGPHIITNIVQGIVGSLTYFIIVEILYRMFYKQSIVTYIKEIIKK